MIAMPDAHRGTPALNWLLVLMRMAGTTTPFTSWAVQLKAELDSRDVQRRLRAIEDPVSSIHPDVQAVSEVIYDIIRATNSMRIELPADVRERYARPLAMLESQHLIKGNRAVGMQPFSHGFYASNATYLLYLAALFEDAVAMDRLVALTEAAKPPAQLNGFEISSDLNIPSPVVWAVFQLYAAKGLGLMSEEQGAIRYIPTA